MNEKVDTNMENKDFDILPVGSVVRLQGGKMNVMVIGFTPVEKGKDKIWDYLGAMWPAGVISSDRNLLFNHDQIERVIYKGYSDDVELEFRNKLEKAIKEIKK